MGAPSRLGPLARQAFAQAVAGGATVFIPVIVLAEVVFIAESGRINVDVIQIIRRIRSLPYLRIIPFGLRVVQRLRAMTGIPDMHDRIIVAECLARKATLITRDGAIRGSGLVATTW